MLNGYLYEYGAPVFDQNFNEATRYYEEAKNLCMKLQLISDYFTYQNYLNDKTKKYLLFIHHWHSLENSCLNDLIPVKGITTLISEYSFQDDEIGSPKTRS